MCFSACPGLCVLCSETEDKQAHPAAVHGQPRAVHASPQAGHDRGAADEGPGPRGEATETAGEVRGQLEMFNKCLCVCGYIQR